MLCLCMQLARVHLLEIMGLPRLHWQTLLQACCHADSGHHSSAYHAVGLNRDRLFVTCAPLQMQ